MRKIGVMLVVLTPVVVSVTPSAQTVEAFEQRMKAARVEPANWPDSVPKWRPPAAPATAAPLPPPSLTEPFAIGEALYDEGRLEQAVVSLLSLMQIAIAPAAGSGLTLDAAEVRTLIDMGREDLEASEDIENLPHSFADLHRAVAALLPELSLDELAAAYTGAYEEHPDDLVAKAMMGQPLEPETRLTRTQIWLLLLDGFAGPSAADARWGTADRVLPDLRPPNPQWSADEWKEVLARLPLIGAGQMLAMAVPGPARQGANGPGANVELTAQLRASVPALVSRRSGKTLVAPRKGTLAGKAVTWDVGEDSVLHALGTVRTPTGAPTAIPADGVARFAYLPGADPTSGKGELFEDVGQVQASFDGCELVSAAYDVPPAMCGFVVGGRRLRGGLPVGWRAPETLAIRITSYAIGVNFDIPGLGGGSRNATDKVEGWLAKRPDGTYRGRVQAETDAHVILRGTTRCRISFARGTQELYVIGRSVAGFGVAHRLQDYTWTKPGSSTGPTMAAEPPDGGYLSLEFFPATEPVMTEDDPDCQPLLPASPEQRGHGATYFLPFNDAQWTIPHAGYGVALRRGSYTRYTDSSSKDPLADLGNAKANAIGAAIKKALNLETNTEWLVRIERRPAAP
ncbi:MAG: hypothetical protein AB7H93_06275 [Vicinamibacterales bacterium]